MALKTGKLEIDRRVGAALVTKWQEGRPLPTMTDFQALLGENTKWVYKCASLNAQTCAAIPLRLYTAVPETDANKVFAPHHAVHKNVSAFLRANVRTAARAIRNKGYTTLEIEEHPLLDTLQNVNPVMGGYELVEQTFWNLELLGNAYWYLVKNTLGVVERIWLLPTQNMYVSPSRMFVVDHYELKGADGQTQRFEPDEIIHFKYSTPNNQFYGMSPLVAALLQVKLDGMMDKFDYDLFNNRAVPEVVLTTDGTPDQTAVDKIKERFKAAFSFRRGNTARDPLILGNGLKVERLTMEPKELHHIDGRKLTMQAIFGVYGVPLTKGDPSEIKANNDAADIAYYRDAAVPRMTRFTEKLNEAMGAGKMLPDATTDVWWGYENPVPEDKQFIVDRNVKYVQAGILVPDEAREDIGKEPLPDGMGATPHAQGTATTANAVAEEVTRMLGGTF